jgi:hypothetical protein
MLPSPDLSTLIDTWRSDAETLRRYGDTRAATICDRHAEEVERAMRDRENELLTLTQAAQISGYSDDHLGRLVRNGRLRNWGQHGSPRVRRGDLPSKAQHLPPEPHSHTVTAAGDGESVRAIIDQMRRGG